MRSARLLLVALVVACGEAGEKSPNTRDVMGGNAAEGNASAGGAMGSGGSTTGGAGGDAGSVGGESPGTDGGANVGGATGVGGGAAGVGAVSVGGGAGVGNPGGAGGIGQGGSGPDNRVDCDSCQEDDACVPDPGDCRGTRGRCTGFSGCRAGLGAICGCDGVIYADDCEGYRAGAAPFDVAGCEVPDTLFVCGDRYCEVGVQRCQVSFDVDCNGNRGSPFYLCPPLPEECGDQPTCDCVADVGFPLNCSDEGGNITAEYEFPMCG